MLRVTFNDGQPEFQGNFSDDLPPTPSPPETSFPSSKKRQRRLLGYSTSNNLPRAPHVKRTSSHFHLERLAHLRTHSPPSLPSPFPILDRVASTVVGRLHTRCVEARTFKVTHRALLAVHFYPSHARTAVFFFFSVHEFDVHGPVSDKAADAGAYDQDSQIVPYSSGPAGKITNMRRLLEKMATL